MAARLSMEFHGPEGELARLGDELAAFGRAAGLADGALHDTQLVAEELVTNSLRHGRQDPPPQVELRLLALPDGVQLEVEDDGEPFDPTLAEVGERDRSRVARKAGGLGLLMVRGLAHELRYERRDGRNHLTIILRTPA